MAITFNNTVYRPGFFGTDDGGVPTNDARSFRIDDVYSFPVTVNGTVTNPGDTVTLSYTLPGAARPTSQTLTATNLDNANMILFTGTGVPGDQNGTANRYVFSNVQLFGSGDPNRTTFADDGNRTLGAYAPVCFAGGTLIRTARGDVAVEHLRTGDLALTSTGDRRAIRWIGHRTIDCRIHRDPAEALPVRIAAGALGENRPERDLRVSPGHAIGIDVDGLGEVLIPASALVNGTTVTQEEVATVTYWHVELDSHDVILAEGQPAESYLDMGNRRFFVGAGVIDIVGTPDGDAASRTHADFCRPFYDAGPVVEGVRRQLEARALVLGWRLESDTWADAHLMVDGKRIDAETQGLSARFVLPPHPRDIWLVSRFSVPCQVGENADVRQLGIRVQGLSIDDGLREKRFVTADNPLLSVGFHECEAGVHRWTAGRALLPAALFEGLGGTTFLRVELAGPALPRWVAPRQMAGTTADGGPAHLHLVSCVA